MHGRYSNRWPATPGVDNAQGAVRPVLPPRATNKKAEMTSQAALRWTIYPISSFDEFANDWDAVNQCAGAVPILTSAFVKPALSAFATGGERLAVLRDGAGVQALAIVARRRRGVWETFQPSQLPLGAWVMRPGLDYAAAGRRLLAALPGFAVLLAITQQDPRLHGRPPAGDAVSTLDYIQTGWIELDASFDDYWKARGKGLRQNMRTQRSKFARDRVTAELSVSVDAADVDRVLDDYARLESGGWKGREGTAVRIDSPQGRFYVAAMKAMCRAGQGQLCSYCIDGRVVAVDLNVMNGDVMVLLKTTYDETLQSLSPSSLLREDLLRRLFEEGRIKRLEFYGPAMEWTYRWTDRVRTLFHVNVYRFGWMRSLHARRQAAAGEH